MKGGREEWGYEGGDRNLIHSHAPPKQQGSSVKNIL
jgi:hypothetical protein